MINLEKGVGIKSYSLGYRRREKVGQRRKKIELREERWKQIRSSASLLGGNNILRKEADLFSRPQRASSECISTVLARHIGSHL